MPKKISELIYGDPKRMWWDHVRAADALRMRLGLPVGCGLSLTDMMELDAVTSKALADAVPLQK